MIELKKQKEKERQRSVGLQAVESSTPIISKANGKEEQG